MWVLAVALTGCKAEKPGAEGDKPGGPSTPPAGSTPSPHGGALENAAHGAPIRGVVALGEGLSQAADVKPTDVLFLMARESQGGGRFGRLVAAQRHATAQFPVQYELSAKDVMVPGLPFAGPFVVMARLDRDGDPMTKGEEDLYGQAPDEVKAGQDSVHVVLKKGAPPPAVPAGPH